MTNQERVELRQLWIARLCNLEDSSMTQEEWCRSHSIPYSTLRYWIRKLRKEVTEENRETNWLKVDTSSENDIAVLRAPEENTNGCNINIRFGAFTIELQKGYQPDQVQEILRILKTL